MKLFVCIFDDARLLKHLLKHYTRFGISEFHIAAPLHMADYVTAASQGYNIRQYNHFNVADSFIGGVEAVTKMRELTQGSDEWIVIIDLDEFVEFHEPVVDIVGRVECEGGNIAQGVMYDRFAFDGQPKSFNDYSDLPLLFPVRARFTKQVMGGVDVKGVLIKGHLKSSAAHHTFYGEKPYSKVLEISHYKWTDRSLDRVRLAYNMCSAARTGWENEYKKILDHYKTHGRFAWETFGGEVAGNPAAIFR